MHGIYDSPTVTYYLLQCTFLPRLHFILMLRCRFFVLFVHVVISVHVIITPLSQPGVFPGELQEYLQIVLTMPTNNIHPDYPVNTVLNNIYCIQLRCVTLLVDRLPAFTQFAYCYLYLLLLFIIDTHRYELANFMPCLPVYCKGCYFWSPWFGVHDSTIRMQVWIYM